MIKTIRTDSKHNDFVQLVSQLDKLLAEFDGREHNFYNQFNKIDKIQYVVLAYYNDRPVACGVIKEFDQEIMEVKRMFTLDQFRGKEIATIVFAELEKWAEELKYERCVLETGKRLPDTIRLYRKNGYTLIPNYGQYIEMDNSICFEKKLKE